MARGFGITLEYDGEGLAVPLAGLRNLRALGQDLTPFMQDAADVMRNSVGRRFDGGFGPDDIPWVPSKRALGLVKGKPPGKTLRDKGLLQGSIRQEVTSNTAEVGSDGLDEPLKAASNQFGSHRPTVVAFHTRRVTVAFGAPLAEPQTQYVSSHVRVTNLPARPFIGIDAQDERDIEEAWLGRIQLFTAARMRAG